jgi:hypothetical protein
VVIELFGLRSWRNRDGRDELVVSVPVDRVAGIVAVIDRLGEEPESWPWLYEDDPEHQLVLAAQAVGISPAALAGKAELRAALRLG